MVASIAVLLLFAGTDVYDRLTYGGISVLSLDRVQFQAGGEFAQQWNAYVKAGDGSQYLYGILERPAGSLSDGGQSNTESFELHLLTDSECRYRVMEPTEVYAYGDLRQWTILTPGRITECHGLGGYVIGGPPYSKYHCFGPQTRKATMAGTTTAIPWAETIALLKVPGKADASTIIDTETELSGRMESSGKYVGNIRFEGFLNRGEVCPEGGRDIKIFSTTGGTDWMVPRGASIDNLENAKNTMIQELQNCESRIPLPTWTAECDPTGFYNRRIYNYNGYLNDALRNEDPQYEQKGTPISGVLTVIVDRFPEFPTYKIQLDAEHVGIGISIADPEIINVDDAFVKDMPLATSASDTEKIPVLVKNNGAQGGVSIQLLGCSVAGASTQTASFEQGESRWVNLDAHSVKTGGDECIIRACSIEPDLYGNYECSEDWKININVLKGFEHEEGTRRCLGEKGIQEWKGGKWVLVKTCDTHCVPDGKNAYCSAGGGDACDDVKLTPLNIEEWYKCQSIASYKYIFSGLGFLLVFTGSLITLSKQFKKRDSWLVLPLSLALGFLVALLIYLYFWAGFTLALGLVLVFVIIKAVF